MPDPRTAEIFLPGGRIGVYLIHGLTGTPTEMLTVAKRLHRRGFTVSCPVLTGHCGSTEDLLATGWKDWARSAEEGFLRLCALTDVRFVGGLSAGAVLCLHLARAHPDKVRAMALYSITLKWNGWSIPRLSFLLPLVLRLPYIGSRYRFVEAFPYGIKNEHLRRRIVAKMRSGDTASAGHTDTPGVIVRELRRLVDNIKKDLANIHTPALLVHADRDDIAGPRGNALYVREHLAGPTELLLLHDSYHMITVDQERHKVAEATARFFRARLTPEEGAELARTAADPLLPEDETPDGENQAKAGA
ncbi:MAG: alpha/beta fold hydrolase [Deltaproteobacteria bacterium]|jgi:carboxylesterase|nr:alpha/beta fold hydrolase [Deltaproteobacteria bacterium]